MAFILKMKTARRVSYPKLQIVTASEEELIDVEFRVTCISSLTEGEGIAEYTATVGDATGSVLYFPFKYSGSGNPLDEAETALQAALS